MRSKMIAGLHIGWLASILLLLLLEITAVSALESTEISEDCVLNDTCSITQQSNIFRLMMTTILTNPLSSNPSTIAANQKDVEPSTSNIAFSSTELSITHDLNTNVKIHYTEVASANGKSSPIEEMKGKGAQIELKGSFSTQFESESTSFKEHEHTPAAQETINLDMEPYDIQLESLSKEFNEIATGSNVTNDTMDECHFLSFEEWKKQKAIDTSNQVQKVANDSSINNVTFKESSSSNNKEKTNVTDSKTDIEDAEKEEDQGKVYKDKFNYASADCAATIVKTNTHAKGASAVLVENKDSYLLNECSSPNKFVVIELCQDILVDSIVIGNFEFFSSMFKNLKVSVSDRFPSTAWKVLGEFEAQNIRDIQTFSIDNPMIWARYLKLEILSHYGNEFYCPISLVRVHGKTMMEEFKEDEESSIIDVEFDDNLITTNANVTQTDEIENALRDECRVILPHLRLNEFLKDLNSSNEFCEALIPEVETTQAIETKTIQESIFKNMMKRLSLLESNASLSLLYIEEQSKLLSTAFTSLERRQTHSFETLVKSFNSTMNIQLVKFKESYLHLQLEYSKLFKDQEKTHKQLLFDSSQKLSELTNELRFQKKISIFNSMIIACLLVYVILTRDAYIEHDSGSVNSKSLTSKHLRRPNSYGKRVKKKS